MEPDDWVGQIVRAGLHGHEKDYRYVRRLLTECEKHGLPEVTQRLRELLAQLEPPKEIERAP